jgi:signal transduction histidine kinase
MWYPKSFAARLALSVLATFGLIQVLLCAFLLVAREAEIRADFDERLAMRAASAVDAAEAALLRTGQLTLAPRAASSSTAFTLANVYWQLSRLDGTVIERSPDLGDVTLPPPLLDSDEIWVEGQAAHVGSWSDPAIVALLRRPGSLRVASIIAQLEGEEPFVVQVARDLEPVTTSLVSLRRQLLFAVVLGFVFSGVASWVLARRVQTGILSMVRQAKSITPESPQRRIESAAGESELRQLATSLNTMLDGLEQALRSREQFLADVSHELKAPLTALAAEARMMAAASRTSDVCRQLDSAVQSVVGSLTGATDALLMLARCSNGEVGPNAAQVSLNEVVTDAVAHCLPRARPRAVRLIPMLPEHDHDEAIVAGHADLLRVMLENLVRNAIDHSPDGAPVHVVLTSEAGHAHIAVRDEGPGIPSDLLPHVFDRYVTGRRSPSQSGGHGLGLGIAKRVVEVHGGAIRLANSPQGGCEVVVQLPLSPEPSGFAHE